jgi:hypothetical protein
MKRHCAIVVLVCVTALCGAVPAAWAQGTDDAFRKDIERLLDITGSSKMGVQMASMASGQILDALAKQSDIPPKAIELAKAVLNEEFGKAFEGPDGLNGQIAGVYAKHFTHDEVRGLLAFYDTPLGRKMISVTPALLQEAGVVGQTWAEKNMPRIGAAVDARLRAEGFIK